MRVDTRDGTGRQFLRYRVLLNGEDVTTQCFLADDKEGVVGLYLRDVSGHFYVDKSYKDGDAAAHEFKHGVVTMIPPVTTRGA